VTRRALLVADLVGLTVAFVLAAVMTGENDPGGNALSPMGETIVLALSLPLWVVAAKLYGLYDRDEEQVDRSRADDLIGVFTLVTVGSWLVFVFTRLTHLADPNVTRLLIFWAGAIGLVAFLRFVARAICRRHASYRQNAIVVGAGEAGQFVARKLQEHPEYGVDVLGFVDFDSRREDDGHPDSPSLLGRPDDLHRLIGDLDVDRVIFAFPSIRQEDLVPLVRELGETGVQVEIMPRFFDVIGPQLAVHSIGGVTVLGLRPFRLERSAQFLKRTVDIVFSVALLLVLAPLFAITAVLIKLDSKGPVFFRQVRMGAGERTFRIWKFRTMVVHADHGKCDVAHLNRHLDADPRMFKAPNDPRITRMGRHLRRFCIDELPQLINVLMGEMSLVGPRPLILDEDQHVDGWARRRLNLRPGMTGLWQVLGGSEIPFDEMIKLDYRYVAGWSLKTDLELIARTIPAVVRERQAY
jgi:exopolysaccharide biosynthesis polyprenyl glycosylphosphotransferase